MTTTYTETQQIEVSSKEIANAIKRIKYHEQLFISNWVPIIDIIRYNCLLLCRSNAFQTEISNNNNDWQSGKKTYSDSISYMSFIPFVWTVDSLIHMNWFVGRVHFAFTTWHYLFLSLSYSIFSIFLSLYLSLE